MIEAIKEKRKGPAFFHVRAISGNKCAPNIPVHHLEIKKQAKECLF